jgi:hypothetical protein
MNKESNSVIKINIFTGIVWIALSAALMIVAVSQRYTIQTLKQMVREELMENKALHMKVLERDIIIDKIKTQSNTQEQDQSRCISLASYETEKTMTHPWKDVVIHHSGSWKDTVESMRRYHLSKGWNGIGYHVVITADGKTVYTERYLEKRRGAHCKDHNDTMGICVVGNFNERSPTQEQLRQLKIVLSGVSGNIYTHRELGNTLCPGQYLQAWVENYREQRRLKVW